MKKILILITTVLLTLPNVYGSSQSFEYANPMPNLVRHVMGNAELLKLTAVQKEAIIAWTKLNKPKMKKLVKKVLIEEKNLLVETLTTDNDVVARTENILDSRREIIKIKTLCRTHLKTILTSKQYNQVVNIYKNELYKTKQIII